MYNIYADPNVDDPETESAETRQDLEALYEQRDHLAPLAEAILQNQLAEVAITQDTLIELGKQTGKDFSQLTVDEFKSRATVFSAQTTLTTFFVLAGVMLMVFAAPPIKWLAGGAPYRGKNWLPTIAAVVLIVAYIIVLLLPGLRSFFDLVSLPPVLHMSVAVLTVLWVLVQRAVWRSRWFERFLDLEESIGVGENGD